MRLFARPRLDAETWWSALEPLMSTQAQQDYYGTDPARVPVAAVTGPGTLLDLDTKRLAIVHVPTDAGLYAITLSRSPEAPEWKVERIAPPEPDPHTEDEAVG